MSALPRDHPIQKNGLTLDETAVLEPLAIGTHAVRRSGLRAGETVLVIGAGPIGLGVMAMEINDERLAYCQTWACVDLTINASEQPFQTILDRNSGEGATIVFDATGNTRSMPDSFGFVGHGGKPVFVGLVKAEITFDDPEFHKRELILMGSRNATKEDFDDVLELIRSGSVDVNR